MMRRIWCWMMGHIDVRILFIKAAESLTAYRCAYCGKVWSEKKETVAAGGKDYEGRVE